MAREQVHNQRPSDDLSRREYLALGGAAALGTLGSTADLPGAHDRGLPEHTLTIVGTNDAPTTYEVTVSERIVPGRYTDALSVLGTTGRSAEDAVAAGVRSYRFDGQITEIALETGATAFVDGVEVDPRVLLE